MDAVGMFETINKPELCKIFHRTWRCIILCCEKNGFHNDILDEPSPNCECDTVEQTAEQTTEQVHKCGLAPSPNCECGATEQTADHVLIACLIHQALHGA